MSSRIKLLILSNQIIDSHGKGNPIIYNYIQSFNNNESLDVKFNSIKYFKDILNCWKIIKNEKFDIVHIHFGGLNCLLIVLLIANRALKVVTFHGTDIHGGGTLKETGLKKYIKNRINKFFSTICIFLIDEVGLVAKNLENYLPYKRKYFVDKLGVDDLVFNPDLYNKNKFRLRIGLSLEKKYFLFSSISNSIIKRFDIAKSIIDNLGDKKYEIIKMNNVKSTEVPNYLSACDYVLITSDKEGSPNIVREALLMNKPIFSVDCGDVKDQIKHSKSSIIISRNPDIAFKQILKQIKFIQKNKNNDRKIYLDKIAWRMIKKQKIKFYCNLLKDKNEK